MAKFDAITCVHDALAIERLMVGELLDEHVCKQARSGNTALDRTARRRRLHDMVAAGTSLLAPDVANHFEGRIDDFQLLGHILTQGLELAAALGAGLVGRLDDIVFTRQVRRQRLARHLARAGYWRCSRRLDVRAVVRNEIRTI